jgi:hypothetical protein
MFHKIWTKAQAGESEFVPMRIRWDDVPGRDEAWKQMTINNTSLEQFRQEYECEFIGSAKTLIDPQTILGMVHREAVDYFDEEVSVYTKPEENHTYVMCVDVASGQGLDYSTFTIIDVTNPMHFKQVATYRSNDISPLMFPFRICRAGKYYNDALVIIENNNHGHVVANAVWYDEEYENMFVTSSKGDSGLGINMTMKVKRIGCSNLKDLLAKKILEVVDIETISEISTFGPRGNSFSAIGNAHDDLVMNLVLFAWFVSTDWFEDMSNTSIRDLISANSTSEIIEEPISPGYFPSLDTHGGLDLDGWNVI